MYMHLSCVCIDCIFPYLVPKKTLFGFYKQAMPLLFFHLLFFKLILLHFTEFLHTLSLRRKLYQNQWENAVLSAVTMFLFFCFTSLVCRTFVPDLLRLYVDLITFFPCFTAPFSLQSRCWLCFRPPKNHRYSYITDCLQGPANVARTTRQFETKDFYIWNNRHVVLISGSVSSINSKRTL